MTDLHVVHAAGPRDFEAARSRLASAEESSEARVAEWRVLDYLAEMPDALAAADLVVARAGATTIAEITAIGRASVLVPYPYATDDHQTLNARTVAEAGACIMVADAELDTPSFGDAILRLLDDEDARARMAKASAALGRRDAADRVADLAREAADAHSRKDG